MAVGTPSSTAGLSGVRAWRHPRVMRRGVVVQVMDPPSHPAPQRCQRGVRGGGMEQKQRRTKTPQALHILEQGRAGPGGRAEANSVELAVRRSGGKELASTSIRATAAAAAARTREGSRRSRAPAGGGGGGVASRPGEGVRGGKRTGYFRGDAAAAWARGEDDTERDRRRHLAIRTRGEEVHAEQRKSEGVREVGKVKRQVMVAMSVREEEAAREARRQEERAKEADAETYLRDKLVIRDVAEELPESSGKRMSEENLTYLAELTGAPTFMVENVALLFAVGLDEGEIIKTAEKRPELFKYSSVKLRKKFALLHSFGLCPADLQKLVLRAPRLLEQKLASTLRTRLSYFESFGLSAHEVAKLLVGWPQLFQVDVVDTLTPRVEYLQREVGGWEQVCKLVRRSPQTLLLNVEERLDTLLNTLCPYGIEEKLLKHKVVINPTMLNLSEARLRKNLEWLKSIGMDREMIARVISVRPQLVWLSVERSLAPKFNFLVSEMGGGVEYAVRNPTYFTLSLDRRIRPRYALKKREEGHKHPSPPPVSYFQVSDSMFASKADISPEKYADHVEEFCTTTTLSQ